MITTGIVKSTFNGISESQILLSETDLCIDRDSIPGVLGGIGVGGLPWTETSLFNYLFKSVSGMRLIKIEK